MSYFKEQLLKTALDEMSEYPVNSEEIVNAVGDIFFELREGDPMFEDEVEFLAWEG